MKSRFNTILTRIERAVILTSYITLILVVSLETLRRVFTGSQAGWGPDVAMYAFVWLAWFSLSSNLGENNQLSFTVLRDRLSPNGKRVLEGLDCLIWMAVGLVVIYSSTQVVMTDIRLNRTIFGTDIPLYAASLAVPIGWTFSMIRIIQLFVRVLRGTPHDQHQDAQRSMG